MEIRKLYVQWCQDIHTRIYKNFPIKEARNSLIAQLVEGYDNQMRKIAAKNHYNQAARQSEANYDLYKLTAGYLKKKREDAMNTIHNYVFGSVLLINFTYTVRKRYLHKFKLQAGQSMKLKNYWRGLKEINNCLPYFLPDKSIGAPRTTPTVLVDNDIKGILDENLPQAFQEIFKGNQYNILVHKFGDAMDYLQNMESTCTTPARGSTNSLSHNSSSKGKSNGKGKRTGKGKS